MAKTKTVKKNLDISSGRLAELRSATLIASAGASTHIEGSKLSNKQVVRVANIVFRQR